MKAKTTLRACGHDRSSVSRSGTRTGRSKDENLRRWRHRAASRPCSGGQGDQGPDIRQRRVVSTALQSEPARD
ncbi:hypothetical protein LC55x_4743 [Lysobacter capsici]|nr:hypothetical protein LC55x_4743 [Lysobacter capsici]